MRVVTQAAVGFRQKRSSTGREILTGPLETSSSLGQKSLTSPGSTPIQHLLQAYRTAGSQFMPREPCHITGGGGITSFLRRALRSCHLGSCCLDCAPASISSSSSSPVQWPPRPLSASHSAQTATRPALATAADLQHRHLPPSHAPPDRLHSDRQRKCRAILVLAVFVSAVASLLSCSNGHEHSPDQTSRLRRLHAFATQVESQHMRDRKHIELIQAHITAIRALYSRLPIHDTPSKRFMSEQDLYPVLVQERSPNADPLGVRFFARACPPGQISRQPKNGCSEDEWEGVFWPADAESGILMVLRRHDGSLWIATPLEADVPSAASLEIPDWDSAHDLIEAAIRAREIPCPSLFWWSLPAFEQEFWIGEPSPSVWADVTRISALWRDALEATRRALQVQCATNDVPLLFVGQTQEGGEPNDLAPISYDPEARELRVSSEVMLVFARLSSTNVLRDERAVFLLLVHEAVHVVDFDFVRTLAHEARSRTSEASLVAMCLAEGHADSVALDVATALGWADLWGRIRRGRQRAMRACPTDPRQLWPQSSLPVWMTTMADLYDVGLKTIEKRRVWSGDGLSLDRLLRGPPSVEELLLESGR